MKNNKYRSEKDSMGSMKVPIDALYGAQTQRAIENFKLCRAGAAPHDWHNGGA